MADDYTRWRASHSPDISPEDLQASAGSYADSPPAQQLSQALREAEDDTAQAEQRRDAAVRGLRVAPEAEDRAARVLRRYQRVLDSKSSPAEISAAARELVASADPQDIPVLAEEFPSLLASKQAPADWLPAALAARVPGAADAATEAKLKGKQLAVLRSNHARLSNSIRKDIDAPPLLDPANVIAGDYTNPSDD
ncbi:hypothetical protein A5621_13055 [Mycobacterium colombiense]|nr:hypothetical protein A5621_13055 [Mycobacterium colombiense]